MTSTPPDAAGGFGEAIDTREARTNDTARQVQALASGAQYISTDYMTPDTRFSAYVAKLPGGGKARLSPAHR